MYISNNIHTILLRMIFGLKGNTDNLSCLCFSFVVKYIYASSNRKSVIRNFGEQRVSANLTTGTLASISRWNGEIQG